MALCDKNKSKTDVKENKNKAKYFPIYAEGKTEQSALKNLETQTKNAREQFNVKLDGKPTLTYMVLAHQKGKPVAANLTGSGRTYKSALTALVNNYAVDLTKFEQTVQIRAVYDLTPPEVKKAAVAKPTSASPSSYAPTDGYI